MIAGNYNKHECKCGHELRVCLATSCEYSELAPVAASLNLDDERTKPKLLPCPFCAGDVELRCDEDKCPFVGCDNCNFEMPAYLHGYEHKAIADWNRRTPPAEVSADGMPALDDEYIYALWSQSYTDALKQAGTGIGNSDVAHMNHPIIFAHAVERLVRAPYAEQIKKLERELVERKQVQSIGDDAEFLWLLGDWMAGLDYFQSDEHKEVKMAWARLIAYIDARPAGTAPEAVAAMERAKKLPVWDDIDHRLHIELDIIFKALVAAPSLSTGTEESK